MRGVAFAAVTVVLGGCLPSWLLSGLPSGGGGGGGLVLDTGGRDPGEPAPGEVIRDCDTDAGYEVDTAEWTVEGEPTLWLASVYEAAVGGGAGSVTFDLPGTHVLALSSYEAVDWEVTVGPDTELQGIYVFSYDPSTVRAPAGVPVTHVPWVGCGYSLPYNGGGCDTDAFLAEVEAAVGLPVHRFDGCYDASTVVYESLAPVEPPPGPACEAGSVVELTFEISAIDMAQGASDDSGPGACTSLVRFADDLGDVGVYGVMLDGVFAQVPYNGVTDDPDCDPTAVHCGDLTYGDGRVHEDYCTVIALCEDGVARATGYTW